MRTAILLGALLLAACSDAGPEATPASDAAPREDGAGMPRVLEHLLVARDADEITPIAFPHGRHAAGTPESGPRDCALCHHMLAEEPDRVPGACRDCHPHERQDDKVPDI
jgi:hypothetical protein